MSPADLPFTPSSSPGEVLDEHWAVAAIPAAERAALLAFAQEAASALAAPGLLPEQVGAESLVALGGAYDFAARERLDLGNLRRAVELTSEAAEGGRRLITVGARRAFLLLAAAPLSTEEDAGALFDALRLAALAGVAGQREQLVRWLAQYRAELFGDAASGDAASGDGARVRWDLQLLRLVVELWTEVLGGAGPSGLDRAMELAATIREQRGVRERELLAACDEGEEMRMRFHLFALHHLGEAATELLVYRLHGRPADVRARVFLGLHLARSASAGDLRIPSVIDWLAEAAHRLIAERTPQLELLPPSLARRANAGR